MDAGTLKITVGWDGARCTSATVASTRPQAARALAGRSADEAVRLVPQLFSLCGRAQGLAARLALAAARAQPVAAVACAAARRAVVLEAIGEHLWRLCLDWPPLLGGAPRLDDFRRWRQRLAAAAPADDAALAAELLAFLPSLAPGAWPAETAAPSVALLPPVAAAEWARVGIDAAFAACPQWQGAPAETGALARHAGDVAVAGLLAQGRRIAARVAARLADLRELAATLVDPARVVDRFDAAPVAAGVGLARVETARGLLLHLMQVKDERVGCHVIVAPTEWNFHPQGAFAGEIAGIPAATRDAAAAAARRLALALDPCVAYEVVVEDA